VTEQHSDAEVQAFFYRAVTTNGRVEALVREGQVIDVGSRSGAEVTSPSALEDFSFNARVQARRMGDVYELLYCLENSVRELIESTLREVFGPETWWSEGVPERLRKAAEKRKQDELKARWHGPRGESLLNYVDFPQYGDVIVAQWDHFDELIGDQDWLVNYFAEMNRTRRSLAHAGTLTETDVERMEFRVREWLRVVG
jgi:hypothetical protein